jgi:hypothetical protein
MGHSKLNLAILIAGFVTLGAIFGQSGRADASVITLDEVVIYASE